MDPKILTLLSGVRIPKAIYNNNHSIQRYVQMLLLIFILVNICLS